MKTKAILLILLFSVASLGQQRRMHRFKTSGLPTGYNILFAGSGECANCHNSQQLPDGQSVALANDWRSTMMGNSSKDPLWRAKVSSEVQAFPSIASVIENKCTSCHAPAGNFNAHHNGQDYSTNDLAADVIGNDGVQCTVCHQITAENIGHNSGELMIGENKTIWGPFTQPMTMPMFNFTGYTPTYSAHIKESALCGTCHTLLTHPVLDDGSLSETAFVEQAIFQEYQNSRFPAEGLSCQDCHMPRIKGPVYISDRPPSLQPRDSFSQHHFVGANLFMNQILTDAGADLGLTADGTQLAATRTRTERMLTEQSVRLEAELIARSPSESRLAVSLKSLAGHKIPTGFPSRRMWIEVIVKDDSGQTMYHSGAYDASGHIFNEQQPFEPHHEVVQSQQETQIYEIIMGDPSGNRTTTLLRALTPLKDNRLLPEGFKSNHPVYDTVQVVGSALSDADYQEMNQTGGFTSDQVTYVLPGFQDEENATITVNLMYQTISPEWLQEIYASGTEESQALQEMVDQSNPEPVVMASQSIEVVSTGVPSAALIPAVYAQPGFGRIVISSPADDWMSVRLFTLGGSECYEYEGFTNYVEIDSRVCGDLNGIYVVCVETKDNFLSRKVFVND